MEETEETRNLGLSQDTNIPSEMPTQRIDDSSNAEKTQPVANTPPVQEMYRAGAVPAEAVPALDAIEQGVDLPPGKISKVATDVTTENAAKNEANRAQLAANKAKLNDLLGPRPGTEPPTDENQTGPYKPQK